MNNLKLMLTGLMMSICFQVSASDEQDMAEMQKQMNAEIISKPFFAEQTEKVDAYIKAAMKKNIKPKEYSGTHWRRGYTCQSLLRYSWREYRNCSYYYRYNGYYYPYH